MQPIPLHQIHFPQLRIQEKHLWTSTHGTYQNHRLKGFTDWTATSNTSELNIQHKWTATSNTSELLHPTQVNCNIQHKSTATSNTSELPHPTSTWTWFHKWLAESPSADRDDRPIRTAARKLGHQAWGRRGVPYVTHQGGREGGLKKRTPQQQARSLLPRTARRR